MSRAILHINVADFAVAVERSVDRRLADRPVIVAPGGAPRAAVYDMSEEAYQAGVRKGMLLRRAARLCRDARVLPPHPDRYERAMADLLRRALPYSPLVEQGPDDGHLFIDITGTSRLFGPSPDVGLRLGRQIRSELGLSPIWSLAPNKLTAKVASRLVKPLGDYVVWPGEEATLLAPLPVHLLPGFEPADLLRLAEFNITRVSQMLALGFQQLAVPFGQRARFLHETARGIDPSPVLPAGSPAPAARAAHEFGTDTNDPAAMEGVLYRLVEQAGWKLRRLRMAARRVALTVSYSDGKRCIRQRSLRPATACDPDLFRQARRLMKTAWHRRVRVRRLAMVCDRLVYPPPQVALFAADRREREKKEQLVAALDHIRGRFGNGAVRVGRTLAA